MASKVLSIVETGYRATVEEQDDTIMWLNNMFKGAGLDVTVLLRGSAVNYATRGQDASGLSFGDLVVSNAPKLDEDVLALVDKGVPVYYVSEDAAERGVPEAKIVDGVKALSRSELPGFLGGFDQVWHW